MPIAKDDETQTVDATRKFTFAGDVAGVGSLDGDGNVTATLTAADTLRGTNGVDGADGQNATPMARYPAQPRTGWYGAYFTPIAWIPGALPSDGNPATTDFFLVDANDKPALNAAFLRRQVMRCAREGMREITLSNVSTSNIWFFPAPPGESYPLNYYEADDPSDPPAYQQGDPIPQFEYHAYIAGTRPSGTHSIENFPIIETMLDACLEGGMTLRLGLSRFLDNPFSNDGVAKALQGGSWVDPMRMGLTFEQRRARKVHENRWLARVLDDLYGDHPAFGGYYLADEPDGWLGQEWLADLADPNSSYTNEPPIGTSTKHTLAIAPSFTIRASDDPATVAAAVASWPCHELRKQDISGGGYDHDAEVYTYDAGRAAALKTNILQGQRMAEVIRILREDHDVEILFGAGVERWAYRMDAGNANDVGDDPQYPQAFSDIMSAREYLAPFADRVFRYHETYFSSEPGDDVFPPQAIYSETDFRDQAQAQTAALLSDSERMQRIAGKRARVTTVTKTSGGGYLGGFNLDATFNLKAVAGAAYADVDCTVDMYRPPTDGDGNASGYVEFDISETAASDTGADAENAARLSDGAYRFEWPLAKGRVTARFTLRVPYVPRAGTTARLRVNNFTIADTVISAKGTRIRVEYSE